MLQTWQQHQDQLVGWFPRHVTSALGPAALKYRTHLETLLFDHEYNVVLTKGAIMHRKYLEAYSVDTPQELRDMVAERRNCEDILMQFVISSRTDSLPVFEWDVGYAPRQLQAESALCIMCRIVLFFFCFYFKVLQLWSSIESCQQPS